MQDLYQQRKSKLANFFFKHKRLPSYSEMLKLFSLKSKNSIAYLVKKFIQDGLVAKDSVGHLIPQNILGKVKVLGIIEAGFPSPAEEELVDTISLDEYLINRKDATFLLKVSGDSMREAGINPGDMVLVERGRQPTPEDIVVAEVDNEWTLKRFKRNNGRVVLMPANKEFSPIYPRETLIVGGVVVAVVRKYH